MIKHLLTITLRNMTKQKVRSIISILCITAGLLCFSVCHYYSTIMSRGNKFLDTYERMAVIRGKNNPNMYIGFSPDKIKGLGNEEILGMAFFTNGTTNFENTNRDCPSIVFLPLSVTMTIFWFSLQNSLKEA